MTPTQSRALLLFALFACSAQGAETPQSWPIDVAVQLGSLGFYPQAANPSVTLGTEYALRRGPVYELALSADLGSVYFRANLLGGLVQAGLTNRFRTPFGLFFEGTIGAGYQLTVFPGTTYAAQDGRFVAAGNSPTSMLRARASLGLGFDFSSLGVRPVRISASYTAFVLTPYASGNGIPVMPGAQAVLALSIPLEVAR